MEFSVPPFTPHSKDTPTGTNEPPRVAYYKLFGRLAAGSNVKVREMDKLFPGLGIEVILKLARIVMHITFRKINKFSFCLFTVFLLVRTVYYYATVMYCVCRVFFSLTHEN